MKWILCYLTLSDNVCFATSDSQSTIYMTYKKFAKWIGNEILIIDEKEFFNKLNSYRTILIDLTTRKWQIYEHKEEDKNYSIEELLKYNENEFDKNKKKEGETLVSKSKDYIKRVDDSFKDNMGITKIK